MSYNPEIIDTREVIEQAEEAQEEATSYVASKEGFIVDLSGIPGVSGEFCRVIDKLGEGTEVLTIEDYAEEVRHLQGIADAYQETVNALPEDAHYGETMIRENHFEEYAQELADEVGAIPEGGAGQWPFYCINWEHAADELRHDYTTVRYQGEDYLVRA